MRILSLLFLVILTACTESREPQEITIRDGMHVDYYPNGQIKLQGNMKDGEREGQWESFFEDGKKWSQSTYLKGELHGPTTVFSSNGSLMYKGSFHEGKRIGQWVFYKDDGSVDYKKDY